jgi:S-adenosylmethionine:tRNA ribosyltransferase-isomerase
MKIDGSVTDWRPGPSAVSPPEARGIDRDAVRLLVSRDRTHEDASFRDLPDLLPPGTLLVVNSSATLPASLPASARFGSFILNLATRYGDRLWLAEPRWSAGLEGPVPLAAGEDFEAAGIAARVLAPFPGAPRLLFVVFAGSVERAMADEGEPIRYGHVSPPWPPLAAYQTVFSDVPGSAEMPSAGRAFTPELITRLAARGVVVAPLLLHTGVASLEHHEPPYEEYYRVAGTTAELINAARRHGRRVIAVGTTVVRALETVADEAGRVHQGEGWTSLVITPGRRLRAVSGLLTGLHEPRASHLAMLRVLAGEAHLGKAYAEALRERYLWHEFGDMHLMLP